MTAAGAEVIPGQYIVTLKPGVSPDSVADESRRRGAPVEHVYRQVSPGFAARMSTGEAAQLRSDPRVLRVEPDQVVHAVDTVTQTNPPSWGLDRIDERAPDATSAYTYDASAGSGVTAYVIDTGINAGHSDFAGRVAPGRNYVPSNGTVNSSATADCNGHGTHVAGTIGGTTYGVAKAVTLVPVRVLDCSGSGTWSDVIAGLNWVAAQHTTGNAVANLSLGGGYSASVNSAVATAVADGVVVAVAAGNSNANACNASPASEPSALTVGATDSSDNRASFSNYGTCVDLFAPGVSITSDWTGSSTATNTISGTSMASPHVAGAAALYLSMGRTAADLVADTTTGRVVNPGTGSPNRLLYVGAAPCDGTSCPPAPPGPVPPANDPFETPQAIVTASGQITGSSANATKQAGEPNHAGYTGGRSVWFRMTAPSSGTATIDTYGSSFDTLLAVYTGSAVNALTRIASNDDSSGDQSRVQFSMVAGTTYQIAVDGYNAASGTVVLNWSSPESTAWIAPTTNAADTGGDGNGYQTTPENAYADDGVYAVDTDSGTGTSTSCTAVTKDKHRFSDFGVSVPRNAKGIQVQVQAKVESTSSSPKVCVQLSWNGGTSWTAAKSASLGTAERTLTLGGTTDLWGRSSWTPTDLANLRVRIIDVASSTTRDFSLDAVAVRVTY